MELSMSMFATKEAYLRAENAALRDQLKAARNQALEDAVKACEAKGADLYRHAQYLHATGVCARAIRAMKEE